MADSIDPALIVFGALNILVLFILTVFYCNVWIHMRRRVLLEEEELKPQAASSPRRPRGSVSQAPSAPLLTFVYDVSEDHQSVEMESIILAPTISAYSTQTVRGTHALTILTALTSVFLMLLNVINMKNGDGQRVQPVGITILNGIFYFLLLLVGAFPSRHPHPNGRASSPLCRWNVPSKLGAFIHVAAAKLYLVGPSCVGIYFNARNEAKSPHIFLPLCCIAVTVSFIFSTMVLLAGRQRERRASQVQATLGLPQQQPELPAVPVAGSEATIEIGGIPTKASHASLTFIPRRWFSSIFLLELWLFTGVSALYTVQEVWNYA